MMAEEARKKISLQKQGVWSSGNDTDFTWLCWISIHIPHEIKDRAWRAFFLTEVKDKTEYPAIHNDFKIFILLITFPIYFLIDQILKCLKNLFQFIYPL